MPPTLPTPRPPQAWTLRLTRGLGFAGVGAAAALAVTWPGELDPSSAWWTAWVAASAVLLLGFPLTMLALWRNADHRPELDPHGRPRTDARGRPRRRRVERAGSRALFTGLALQAASLVLLAGLLLALALGG